VLAQAVALHLPLVVLSLPVIHGNEAFGRVTMATASLNSL
jgi:hypothetical protein